MSWLDSEAYRQAFLSTPAPALLLDDAFVVREINGACLDLGDHERSDIVGESPLSFFDDPAAFEELTDALARAESWTGEFEVTTTDGRIRFGQARAEPLGVDAAGDESDPSAYLVVFMDTTRSRQTRQSLRILNRVLRHNLRNDANVVLGHLNELRESADDDDREAIDTAVSRVESMLSRAETTREFSRVLAGDNSEALYPVRVGNAVQQALAQVDAADADIEVDLPAEPLFATADETLTPAVAAVVENAVIHAGEEPRVEIEARYDGDGVVLSVADDGPGIDPGRRDQIFGREELSSVRHGEGLSLFFVDRLLSVYGGSVAVRDNDPTGAVFELRFRRADADDAVTGKTVEW